MIDICILYKVYIVKLMVRNEKSPYNELEPTFDSQIPSFKKTGKMTEAIQYKVSGYVKKCFLLPAKYTLVNETLWAEYTFVNIIFEDRQRCRECRERLF